MLAGAPYTFYGRVNFNNERCYGRVIPQGRCCMFIRKRVEHKRYNYDILVNTSETGLVWRKDYDGHVPNTAVNMGVKVSAVPATCAGTSDAFSVSALVRQARRSIRSAVFIQ